MSSADPFPGVKEEVVQAMNNARALFSRWKTLLESENSDDEFEWTTKELKTALKNIEYDLEDLAETITVVEANPARFKISAQEVTERKQFVSQTKDAMGEIKRTLNDYKAKAKTQQQNRQNLLAQPKNSKYAKLEQEIARDNQQFIDNEQQHQQQLIRQQDETLEDMSSTINILKHYSEMIGDELDEQNEMLTEFDQEMDNTTDKLKQTLKKVDRALEISKDGKQSCMICLLLVILLILIIVYFT
eukprot:m.65587 g.65587  ORF g.65587 m.65587 type:complete len:245 (+) comp13996_c0_seq1:219-953(+)